jgi:nucleotide-binding universal stress UspA family protein
MSNVLLAIDGPIYGKVIEDFVVNHRWAPATNFKLFHVSEPLPIMDEWPEARLDIEQLKREQKYLDDVSARIQKAIPNSNVSYELCRGFPAEEIIAKAGEWPAQMVIVGSHGRHGFQRFLLGSVSATIMMHAPCSVVMIRLPKGAQDNCERELASVVAKKEEGAIN